MRSLYTRTHTEVLVFAVRSNDDHFLEPCTFSTTARLQTFFQTLCGRTAEEFAKAMETYCLTGVDGSQSCNPILVVRSSYVHKGVQVAENVPPMEMIAEHCSLDGKSLKSKSLVYCSYVHTGIPNEVTPAETTAQRRSRASDMILEALRESVVTRSFVSVHLHPEKVAAPDVVSKMFYVNFDEHITNKFGIVLEGWPLKKLVAPGIVGSRPDVDVIINAFSSGVARFRRLSPAELESWRQERFRRQRAAAPVPTAPTLGAEVLAATSAGTSSSPLSSPRLVSGSSIPASAAYSSHIFSVATAEILPPKKPRAKRKDSGIARGPNKRTTAKKASGASEGHVPSVPQSR